MIQDTVERADDTTITDLHAAGLIPPVKITAYLNERFYNQDTAGRSKL